MYDIEKSGKRLKHLRNIRGKTQQEVADEIGISVDTIRKLEKGKRGASADVIDMIKEYYGTTADYIISGCVKDQNGICLSFSSVPEGKRPIVERLIASVIELL